MPGLSADESRAVKQERREASIRAAAAYTDEINASGNIELAKFAARYAAAGRSIFITGNAGPMCSGKGEDRRIDTILEIRPEEQTGRPCYQVRGLCNGRALVNRRPGARYGWSHSWANEEERAAGVFIGIRKIDGSDYAIFRVRLGSSESSDFDHTVYFAQVEPMTWRILENSGECDAIRSLPLGPATSVIQTGQLPLLEYRPVRVSGFTCNWFLRSPGRCEGRVRYARRLGPVTDD